MKLVEILDVNVEMGTLLKFVYFLSVVVPVGVLCLVDFNSFNYTWKGRAYYLFFMWLFFMEFYLGWEKIRPKLSASIKKILLSVFLMIFPTFFVVWMHYFGLKQIIIDFGAWLGIPFPEFSEVPPWQMEEMRQNFLFNDWPLSMEYLILTVLFVLSLLVLYSKNGLKHLSVSHSFIFLISLTYLLDTLYPYGTFTPFQFLVPFTTSYAAQIFNLMGFKTEITGEILATPKLRITSNGTSVSYGIGWPCAGIQGLFIYTFTILLFLKDLSLSLKRRAIIYSVGALGAYTANALRIVLIYIITIEQGLDAARTFHAIYGGLLSMSWIVIYVLIITVACRKYLFAKSRE